MNKKKMMRTGLIVLAGLFIGHISTHLPDWESLMLIVIGLIVILYTQEY